MGQTIRQNPETYDFLANAIDVVVSLVERLYGIHRTEAYPVIRQMVYTQRVPDKGSPLNVIVSLTMIARRAKNGSMKYMIQVERIEFKGKAKNVVTEEYPFDYSDAWEDAPAEIQNTIIRQGTQEYRMNLYNLRDSD
jgi:hypothetical protein